MVLIGSVGSLPDPDDRFLHVLYTQFFFFFFFVLGLHLAYLQPDLFISSFIE
ncbi:hypothetical protein HanPSC8_Chr13g0574531 [Helianthus annuus]|nr:hypothetical protein HanPSC8_Chr13g0574531 [Helianthus annuus]